MSREELQKKATIRTKRRKLTSHMEVSKTSRLQMSAMFRTSSNGEGFRGVRKDASHGEFDSVTHDIRVMEETACFR